MAEEFHLYDGIGDISLSCVVMLEINLVGNPKEWWVDTRATCHVCCDKKMFSTYKECGEQLFMGNSSIARAAGIGKVILKMTSGKELTLNNVLHVPEIRKNLIAGFLMLKNGFKLVFEFDKFVITKVGMYVGRGYMTDGMFKLNTMTIVPKNSMNEKGESSIYIVDSSILWHGRLGHVNYGSLKRMINLECLPKSEFGPNHKCQICVEAKMTKVPFKNVEINTEPLGLIHIDICDIKFIQTKGGKKYFITFIDDSSRYCYVYLLRRKHEAVEVFKHYKLEVENQLGKTIKIIRSDRGGEYDTPFDEFCLQNGIIHQTTTPYSPRLNGVTDRKNRTLKEMMNAMLTSSGLPQNLWGKAILSANNILNRITPKRTNQTPFTNLPTIT